LGRRRLALALALAVAALLSSLALHRLLVREERDLVPVEYEAPPLGSYPWDRASGFIRARGSRFYFDDGTPFFAIGVNYEGWYDRCWRMWEDDLFDPRLIERDFAKMRWLGVNTVRIFVQAPLARDILRGEWRKLDAVVEIARRYRVFLLVTLWDYQASLSEAVRVAELIAQRYANETIILGYDLKNEPPVELIASVEGWRAYLKRKYGSVEELDRAWRRVNPRYGLAEAERRGFEHIGLPEEAWDSPRWADFMRYLNEALEGWIRAQVEAIRRHDRNHLITVGYNDIRLAVLPANELLDFISIHTYFNELREEGQRPSLMVLDFLQALFPGKPVVYEEFGLSNHVGDYVVSASKEATIYFYAFFKGFAGAFKWMLNDHVLNPNPYEEKFGVFTLRGGREYAKPVAFAIRAFSRIVAKLLEPPPIERAVQFVDNPAYRLQMPWEYFHTVAFLPLYGYRLSPDEGAVALYPASCYGLRSVEERVAKLLAQKPVIFVRLIDTGRTFDPERYEVFSRADLYGVPVVYPERRVYRVNGSVIEVATGGDVPLAANGTPVILDDGGAPLANALGRAILLPFVNVLSKLPLGTLAGALERLGLRDPTKLGAMEVCASAELPLAFRASGELFRASFSREGEVFVPYRAEREGIVIGVKEGGSVLLYTTVRLTVEAESCEVVYGEAVRVGGGWLLGPGEYRLPAP